MKQPDSHGSAPVKENPNPAYLTRFAELELQSASAAATMSHLERVSSAATAFYRELLAAIKAAAAERDSALRESRDTKSSDQAETDRTIRQRLAAINDSFEAKRSGIVRKLATEQQNSWFTVMEDQRHAYSQYATRMANVYGMATAGAPLGESASLLTGDESFLPQAMMLVGDEGPARQAALAWLNPTIWR